MDAIDNATFNYLFEFVKGFVSTQVAKMDVEE